MTFPVPISLETQPISIQEQSKDEPMLYVLIFFMVLVFFSGICWIFCCGSCVGRDTLRAIGLGRFVASPNKRGRRSIVRGMRNYKYSPAFTDEEEWEMFEGAGVNNNEESAWDNNQNDQETLQ
ncbi:3011_t:CDS:1 [Funneliformis geosporum]|uniref:6053_t:CDS:1 n=1 Tax=Funneliformis geosporum TaxID=1117311 RepID=A0A9W4WMA2_9GLOM|nr:3011_t:CDS:1 [Funneliformis geosporum]CAI2172593.1 6053_t:CDS:1 [Funneliformis geosporum]